MIFKTETRAFDGAKGKDAEMRTLFFFAFLQRANDSEHLTKFKNAIMLKVAKHTVTIFV